MQAAVLSARRTSIGTSRTWNCCPVVLSRWGKGHGAKMLVASFPPLLLSHIAAMQWKGRSRNAPEIRV